MTDWRGFKMEKYMEDISKKIESRDVGTLIQREDEIKDKIGDMDISRYSGLIKQLKILLSMIKDYYNGVYRGVPWATVAMIVFAIIYFLNPFDIVSDFIPFLGYVDDVTVVGAVVKAIGVDLRNYARFKGIDTKELGL